MSPEFEKLVLATVFLPIVSSKTPMIRPRDLQQARDTAPILSHEALTKLISELNNKTPTPMPSEVQKL